MEKDEVKIQNKKELKRRIENKLFLLSLTGITICSAIFTGKTIAKYKILKDYNEYVINDYDKDLDFDINTIKGYINSNNNLSDKEKKFIIDRLEVIIENQEYVNMNNLKYVLPKLKIIYAGDDRKKYGVEGNVNGLYQIGQQRIVIFKASCLEEADENVLFHELNHALSRTETTTGLYLKEALNETISSEYMGTECIDDRCYVLPSLVLFSLCEIIGSEPFKEFHFSSDINVIINSLTTIIDDREKAKELIDTVDKLFICNQNLTYLVSKHSTEELANYYSDWVTARSRLYGLIRLYYEKKYNVSLETNQEMVVYLDYFLTEKSPDRNMICKGYFDDDYIESHPTITYKETNTLNKTK